MAQMIKALFKSTSLNSLLPSSPRSSGSTSTHKKAPEKPRSHSTSTSEVPGEPLFWENGFDPRRMSFRPPKPWEQWTLDDFEIGKPLGEGGFGHVYLARTERERRLVALKVLHIDQIEKENMAEQVNKEIDIHSDLNHENIIKMYGWFVDKEKFVIALEYAPGGDVWTAMKSQPGKRFNDSTAATYIFQITNALEYLHERGIVHRDIKPENLLIGYNGEIKMADFGWSVKLSKEKQNRRKTLCGTLYYLPPEMIQKIPHNANVDLWCLGVLCYEFLTGTVPFEGDNDTHTQRKISAVELNFPEFVNPMARDLMEKLILKDPEQRLNLQAIRVHGWVHSNKTLGKHVLGKFAGLDHINMALEKRYEEAARRYQLYHGIESEFTEAEA